MDEINLSKQELEQSEEEYRQSFAEYRLTLQLALTKKDQELIEVKKDLMVTRFELQKITSELKDSNDQLRRAETELLAGKKEAAIKKTTFRLQGLLVSFLFLLSTVLTSIGINVATTSHGSSLGLIMFFLGAFTFILAAVVSITTVFTFENKLEKTQQKPGYPPDTIAYPRPLPEDFEILRKELVYEYMPDGITIFQRKRHHVRALKNNLQAFTDRYRWSGTGKAVIRSLTPNYMIINERKGEDGIWDYFDVKFPHSLKKNEEIDFTIEWELNDESKDAVPFLSTMIDRETKYLLLQVILPNSLAPHRAYFHEYYNFIDTLPIKTETVSWSPATKSIIYEIDSPIKYHKYTIRWYK